MQYVSTLYTSSFVSTFIIIQIYTIAVVAIIWAQSNDYLSEIYRSRNFPLSCINVYPGYISIMVIERKVHVKFDLSSL